jgi:hypothetical protein
MPQPPLDHLKQWSRGPQKSVRVELAPGRIYEIQVPVNDVPRFILARLTRRADGLYQVTPVEWTSKVRLTKKLLRDLGLDISDHVVRRLIKAGFVEGSTISPLVTLIDLESLKAHIERTSSGGDSAFWTAARVDAYRTAFGPLKEG